MSNVSIPVSVSSNRAGKSRTTWRISRDNHRNILHYIPCLITSRIMGIFKQEWTTQIFMVYSIYIHLWQIQGWWWWWIHVDYCLGCSSMVPGRSTRSISPQRRKIRWILSWPDRKVEELPLFWGACTGLSCSISSILGSLVAIIISKNKKGFQA